MKTTIATFSALALASALACAQDQTAAPSQGPDQRPAAGEIFKNHDTNGDGSLSLDEFKAGPLAQRNPDKAGEIFKKMDGNNDGMVTLDEFKNFRPQAGKRGGERPAPATPGVPVE